MTPRRGSDGEPMQDFVDWLLAEPIMVARTKMARMAGKFAIIVKIVGLCSLMAIRWCRMVFVQCQLMGGGLDHVSYSFRAAF